MMTTPATDNRFHADFMSGVESACKRAGLSAEDSARVAAVLASGEDKAAYTYRTSGGLISTPTFSFNRPERALLGAGAAALASLPYTAITNRFRREYDEDGNPVPATGGYARNAALAGLVGGALGAYPVPLGVKVTPNRGLPLPRVPRLLLWFPGYPIPQTKPEGTWIRV
jgi:hypothetical protein